MYPLPLNATIMKKKPIFHTIFLLLIFVFTTSYSQKDPLFGTERPLWKPVSDEVFLQEKREKIFSDRPVTSVGMSKEECYAVMGGKVYAVEGDELSAVPGAPGDVFRLKTVNGTLWAMTEKGIYSVNGTLWDRLDDKKFVDVCFHLGSYYAATRDAIYRLEGSRFVDIKPEGGYLSSDITMVMEDGSQVLADPVRIGPIERIVSYAGSIHILNPGRLSVIDGKVANKDFVDWGRLPSPVTRDMISYGSRVFIATDKGLGVLRGAALTQLVGKDGLPYENTTCLATGFDRDLWIGTTKGAVRMLDNDWHFFAPQHWLPGPHVYDIAVADDKTVYIATDKGIGIIRYEPFTLLKKAEFYEKHIKEWGHQRLGFIHNLYRKDGKWIREISDNDGGHTAPYLAAMSYKYAVTGDEAAREEAVNAFKAMIWLEKITPIDGLIARAIWSPTGDEDQMSRHGSGGLPAKWYKTKDGKWYWKGDTSSDEIIAHFYSVSLFYELVARGKEKEVARRHLASVAEYIMKNGWKLIDVDGNPTRWGRWDPKYLLSPYGYMDKGLNGLEAMTFMKTALAMTGDKKYEDGYRQLVDFGYLRYIVRQKNTFPPENVTTWDDNLAFRSYYTIMRYADDPLLRSILLRSLERTFEVKRMERVGWFNFSYGAITGNDCEADRAAQQLREMPLDCREWSYTNSFRDDLFVEPGYVSYVGAVKSVSPRESCVKRATRSTLQLDGGAGGRRVMEPTGFLRDYWMARYHGLIKAPEVTDKILISVPAPETGKYGAAPYSGPKRPKIY